MDGADGRPIVCSQLVAFCVDPSQGSAIRSKCPATCGACPGFSGPYTCADTPRPYEIQPDVQASTCKELKSKCKDDEEGEAVRQLCPATCKVCKKTKRASATNEGSAKAGKEQRRKSAKKAKDQEEIKKKPLAEPHGTSSGKPDSKATSKKATPVKKQQVKKHKQRDVAL